MSKGLQGVIALVVASILSMCNRTEPEDLFRKVTAEDMLNANADFLYELNNSDCNDTRVKSFDVKRIGRDTLFYLFTFEPKKTVAYYPIKERITEGVPNVSVTKQNGVLVWVLNGRVLSGTDGSPVAVEDKENKPRFSKTDKGWIVTINGMQQNVADSVDAKASMPQLTFSPSEDFLICTFDDSTQIISPTYLLDSTLARVPNRGFYKDVFMDAGAYLTSHRSLSAVSHLGYTMEYVNCPRKGVSEVDTAWQNSIIGGCEEDSNGRLLYPDGAPRYKMIYVCGGDSRKHGRSMRALCLENLRSFVMNGGSYVGTCAGAFFVGNGYDTVPDYPYYLKLWPGVMKHTGIYSSSTGMSIGVKSSLLAYSDFGGDYYVADIRHNIGGYAATWPVGTEQLATYDCPQKKNVHGKPSTWAYKPNQSSGRIVVTGSHPEDYTSGERREFMESMLQYAADGVGLTKIKGVLRNGKTRKMNVRTDEGPVDYSVIGDRQYHHFVVYIPKGAKDITLNVESEVDCDLQLLVSDSTYAYADVATLASSGMGSEQVVHFQRMAAGLWYVSVTCHTTVSIANTVRGQQYGGRTDVLDGVPYTISVNWNLDE